MKKNLLSTALIALTALFSMPQSAWADIDFGSEETVSSEKTWVFGDLKIQDAAYTTITNSLTSTSGETVTKDYYLRATTSGAARSFSVKQLSSSVTMTFADGNSESSASAYLYNAGNMYNNAPSPTTTAGSGTVCYSSFAFNATVAGTVYAKVKYKSASGATFRIYFCDGTSVTTNEFTGTSSDTKDIIEEIAYTSSGKGSFFITSTSNGAWELYAVRFVPTSVSRSSISNENSWTFNNWPLLNPLKSNIYANGLFARASSSRNVSVVSLESTVSDLQYGDGTNVGDVTKVVQLNYGCYNTWEGALTASSTKGKGMATLAFSTSVPGTAYAVTSGDANMKMFYGTGESGSNPGSNATAATVDNGYGYITTSAVAGGHYFIGYDTGASLSENNQIYAIKFVPEAITAPTINAGGTITEGTSNMGDNTKVTIKTYYTYAQGSEPDAPTNNSTEYDPSNGITGISGTYNVKAITYNTQTGVYSDVTYTENVLIGLVSVTANVVDANGTAQSSWGSVKKFVDNNTEPTGLAASYERNSNITIIAIPNSGYQFVGWKTADGTANYGNAPQSLLLNLGSVAEDVSVRAVFKAVPSVTAVASNTLLTFNSYTVGGTKLAGNSVYGDESLKLYLSGHDQTYKNHAEINVGTYSYNSDEITFTSRLSLAGGVSRTLTDAKYTAFFNGTWDAHYKDAVAFKVPSAGKVIAYVSGASNRVFNLYVNNSVGTTKTIASEEADVIMKMEATVAANDNVLLGTTSGNGYVYGVQFVPTYDITVTQPASGGTVGVKVGDADVTTGNTTATAGQTITLSNTPAENYTFTSYSVKKTEGGDDVTVTDGSFTMPDYAITITAEFEADSESEKTVSDATTWTFNDYTASETPTTTVSETAKLYNRSTSNDSKGFTFTELSQDITFSDGESVSITKIAKSTSTAGSSIATSYLTAGDASSSKNTPMFAINTSVPGTFYAWVKNGSTDNDKIRLYYGKTNEAAVKKAYNSGADLQELKYKATDEGGGVFFIGGIADHIEASIYAIRFVPATYKYAITLPAQDEQGNNVTADVTSAAEGETVTLTVTLASGYQLKSGTLKVNDGDVTLNEGNTFTMPAKPVTITAEFETESPDVTEISSVSITEIDAPVKGTALDTEATCSTTGVESVSFEWKKGDDVVTGNAEANTVYTAVVTLTAASSYAFASEPTATISGNNATVTRTDDTHITVSYTFAATEEVPVYGTFDFRTFATEKVSATTDKVTADRDANGVMLGSFTPTADGIADGITVSGSMQLNGALKAGRDLQLRRKETATSGLLLNKAETNFSLLRLNIGDWFKIDYAGTLKFTTTNVHKIGSSAVTSNEAVEAGSIYVVDSGTEVGLTFGPGSGVDAASYIYSVQISNDAIPPLVNYKENASNQAVYTITSVDGNTIHYQINNGFEQTTTSTTTYDVSVSEKCTLKAWTVNSSSVAGTATEVELMTTPIVESNGIFDLSPNGNLTALASDITIAVAGDAVANATDGDTGISLYMPSLGMAPTFAGKFAFQAPTNNYVRLREDKEQLFIEYRQQTYYMALVNPGTGKLLTFTDGNKGVSQLYIGKNATAYTYGDAFEITADDLDSDGNLILKFDVGSSSDQRSASITQIGLLGKIDNNVTLTITSDSKERMDYKEYTVAGIGSGETMYYMLPGSTAVTTYTSGNIKCTTGGTLMYWVEKTGYTSLRKTVTVSLVPKPSLKFVSAGESSSSYTLSYTSGTTLYYTLPGATEKTASGGTSVALTIETTGPIVAYAKSGDVVSDILKTNVYAPTPAIAASGKYDFTLLKEKIGSGYTIALGSYPWGDEVTIGDMMLKKPGLMTSKTLDRFAFTYQNSDETSNTNWRLVSDGRLRVAKRTADVYMAILDLKGGEYVTINRNSIDLKYMSQSTAKLADGTDVLTSGQPYKVQSAGHLLLCVPANSTAEFDITMIEIATDETVTAPTLAARTESGVVVPNAVQLTIGTSNFGNTVTAYYTTDGTTPSATNGTAMSASGKVTVDETCTIKAICISTTGVASAVSEYAVTLPQADKTGSVVYDFNSVISKSQALTFSTTAASSVQVMEKGTSGWEQKGRSDFYPVTDFDSRISVRVGAESVTYDTEAATMKLIRPMAIHNLGVGDEIVIMYSGTGSVINVNSPAGDVFTVADKTVAVGEEISSGAVIKITKTKYANNYIVVGTSGDVYINAIYINSKAPSTVTRPKVALKDVDGDEAIYNITFDAGARLYYWLSTGEETAYRGSDTGSYDLTISKSATLKAWAQYSGLVSDTLTTVIYAPTPAPSENGDYDFTESSDGLPADMEVQLDAASSVTVSGKTLYKPTALTEQTFQDKFAFTETNTSGKIKIRTNRQLAFSKGTDMNMALLNMKKGDIIAFDYTGTINFADPTLVKADAVAAARAMTRGDSDSQMTSGTAYVVQQDCNVLMDLVLTSEAVSIAKMYVAAAPGKSDAAAVDFASAAEDEEELEMSGAASVWCAERTAMVKFKRLANSSDNLPIDSKISSENGYGSNTTNGFSSGNRNIAIHALAKGDTIKVRFSGGDVLFYNHASYGNSISRNGKLLVAGDTIHGGDVLKVEKVDYLNNYFVLRLGSGAAISGIFINKQETEKVLMPSATLNSSNALVITSGKSTLGYDVVTNYTTNGTDPSLLNGTGGPYATFEVQLRKNESKTIKVISISESGAMSRILTLTYDGSVLTSIEDVFADREDELTEEKEAVIYDLLGRRVTTMTPGHIYIVNGKKRFYNKR